MSYLEMYILLMLDGFTTLASVIAAFCLVWTGIVFFGCVLQDGDSDIKAQVIGELYADKALIIGTISLLLALFVPNTKQAALIYITPRIVNNEAVSDTVKNMPELTKLGTDYLKELLKEKVDDIKR